MVSISDVVVRHLDKMRFLHPGFRKNLVNYSAVARLITPAIERELGGVVKQPAILAAIQRYAEALQRQSESAGVVNSKIADCELFLKMNFFLAHFVRGKTDLLTEVYSILANVNWDGDERFYITQRSFEIAVCGSEIFKQRIQKLGKTEKFFILEENLALLSIKFPAACHKEPGLLFYFISQLEQLNVNVFQIFSTFEMVSFVLAERDAPRVIESFKNAINEESVYSVT